MANSPNQVGAAGPSQTLQPTVSSAPAAQILVIPTTWVPTHRCYNVSSIDSSRE